MVKNVLKTVIDWHVISTVLWALLIAVGSLFIFLWLMDPQSWIYSIAGVEGNKAPFFPKNMSQEESGYFGALGGWAIGFAGALVAIKIAGVATNIQENDSIRSIESDIEKEVQRISTYNSDIEVAALDAKRACTSILIDIQAKNEARSRKQSIFNNELSQGNTQIESEESSILQEDLANRQNLTDKLMTLVKAIENAVRDPIFIQATKNCLHTHQSNPSEPTVASLDEFFSLINKTTPDARERFEKIISDYSDVIVNDELFFDFFKTYEQATHNFAAGINNIRAEPVYLSYKKDIDFLLEQDKNHSHIALNPSEASWLLLGLLLLQEVDHNIQNRSLNHGFIFLALMMGSLPNSKSTLQYFQNKYAKLQADYGATGRKKITSILNNYSATVYYPKGLDQNTETIGSGFLNELNNLITRKVKKGSNSILYVKSKTKGLSLKERDDGTDINSNSSTGNGNKEADINLAINSQR